MRRASNPWRGLVLVSNGGKHGLPVILLTIWHHRVPDTEELSLGQVNLADGKVVPLPARSLGCVALEDSAQFV